MWIKRIELRNYRGVTGSWDLAPRRVNVLCLANGEGKSAITEAVLMALFAPGKGDSISGSRIEINLFDRDHGDLRVVSDHSSSSGQDTVTRPGSDSPLPEFQGTSFGAARLGLSRNAFEFCYANGRAGGTDIAGLLEREMESRRLRAPLITQKILGSLSASTVGIPQLKMQPTPVADAVEQLEQRLRTAEAQLLALTNARDQAIADGHAAERLRTEAEALGMKSGELRNASHAVELDEIRAELNRLESGEENGKHRADRIASLLKEPIVNPAQRPTVDLLLTEWEIISARTANAHAELLRLPPEESGREPEPAGNIQEELVRLRSLRVRILALRGQVDEKLRRIETDYPPDKEIDVSTEDESLLLRLEALPGEERQELLALAEELEDGRKRLTEVEEESKEARRTVEVSRAQRERLSAVSATSVALAAVGSVAGVVLWLTAFPIAAAATGAMALGLGATGLEYAGRGRRKASAALEPALAQELTLSGTSNRLHERVDTLLADISVRLRRAGIHPDDLSRIENIGDRIKSRSPRRNAELELDRLRFDLTAAENEAREAVHQATSTSPDQVPTGQDPVELIGDAVDLFTAVLQREEEDSRAREAIQSARKECRELEEEKERLASELLKQIAHEFSENASSHLAEQIVQHADVKSAIEEYQAACARGAELAELQAQELASSEGTTLERINRLRSRSEELDRLITGNTFSAFIPTSDKPSSSVMRSEAEEALRRAEDLKTRSAEAYARGESAIETYRRSTGHLAGEITRLKHFQAVLRSRSEALQVAAQELQLAAEHAFSGWQGEVGAKAERHLVRAIPELQDYSWADSLERPPSAFSTKTGARLTPPEFSLLGSGLNSITGLALRRAVAEQLAPRLGLLPMILDEPFPHLDDLRFAEAMRMLVSYAGAGGQVLLLTGQRSRMVDLDRSNLDISLELHMVRTAANPVGFSAPVQDILL